MCRTRRLAAVLACAASALGVADSAVAGTASGRPAQFTAAPGERNDLAVDAGSGGAVQFADAGAPIAAALPWCTPFPLGQALCDPDGDPRDTDGGGVGVDLSDGDDRLLIRWIPGTGPRPGAISVAAGAGNDRIENQANGVIRFDGGAGDDTLLTGPTAGAILRGGAGADLLDADGDCCATAGYDDHDAAGVRVTLDRTANDGAAGEGDDVRTSGVVGSPGPDAITGDAGPNALTGFGGADAIAGAGGDDRIDATVQQGADERDSVTCGAGRDDVTADADDAVAVDCERVGVGRIAVPSSCSTSAPRVPPATGRSGPPTGCGSRTPTTPWRREARCALLDTRGRAVSSTARFVLGAAASTARVRVTLGRAARRRLARSRSGRLALVAQRVSRNAEAELAAAGYERVNVAVTIRRAR